jgi:hypothetical protein
MAKTYTELEVWGIFIGALIIGIVLTSLFWAYITVPDDVKIIEEEIKNASESEDTIIVETPNDFVTFCSKTGGTPEWDSSGLRKCTIVDSTEKNLLVMDLLCRKFNLTMSYGSYGVRCEGTV